MKKRIVVLSPYPRDVRELSRIPKELGYEIIYDDFIRRWLLEFENLIYPIPRGPLLPLTIEACVKHVVGYYKNEGIDGVLNSDDYPASIITSIVAEQLGLPGPSPYVVLCCEHKYYSRSFQQKYVPEAVPSYHLLEKHEPHFEGICFDYPLFMKPVKSYFSVHAYKIHSFEELKKKFYQCTFPPEFLSPFDAIMREYIPEARSATGVMLETCLAGHQLTLEGYVYNHKLYTMGLVDSIMFPGTISFQRFEYPSVLPEPIQKRIEAIVGRFMLGIGFNNSFFNIELFYNFEDDTIFIIEVNPRMASQFADLYEKVDGINSYQVALDIAVGKKPKFSRRQGRWALAASCVLRTFENKRIIKMPSQEAIDRVYELFPDTRIELYGAEGTTLAQLLQDSMSYRYGLIHLGGNSREDIEEKLQICQNLLKYTFTSV